MGSRLKYTQICSALYTSSYIITCHVNVITVESIETLWDWNLHTVVCCVRKWYETCFLWGVGRIIWKVEFETINITLYICKIDKRKKNTINALTVWGIILKHVQINGKVMQSETIYFFPQDFFCKNIFLYDLSMICIWFIF